MVSPDGAGKRALLGATGGTIHDCEGRIERDPAQRVASLQASALDRSFPVRMHEVVGQSL